MLRGGGDVPDHGVASSASIVSHSAGGGSVSDPPTDHRTVAFMKTIVRVREATWYIHMLARENRERLRVPISGV